MSTARERGPRRAGERPAASDFSSTSMKCASLPAANENAGGCPMSRHFDAIRKRLTTGERRSTILAAVPSPAWDAPRSRGRLQSDRMTEAIDTGDIEASPAGAAPLNIVILAAGAGGMYCG